MWLGGDLWVLERQNNVFIGFMLDIFRFVCYFMMRGGDLYRCGCRHFWLIFTRIYIDDVAILIFSRIILNK
jgi:hypothetical protein